MVQQSNSAVLEYALCQCFGTTSKFYGGQVWQAILVRQVDLDSPQAKQQLSEGARDLLSVSSEQSCFKIA